MCKQTIYEGHEFHNQSLRKDLKILRNSAVPQYVLNPKLFCSFGNQALDCASTEWEWFTSIKQFNLHYGVTSPSGVLPSPLEKIHPTLFYPALCTSAQNNTKGVWTSQAPDLQLICSKNKTTTEQWNLCQLSNEIYVILCHNQCPHWAVLTCVPPAWQAAFPEWWVTKLPEKAWSISKSSLYSHSGYDCVADTIDDVLCNLHGLGRGIFIIT